jgi:DNA-nicking Smr family endonuclease
MLGVTPQSAILKAAGSASPKQADKDSIRQNAEYHPEPQQRALTLAEVPVLQPGDVLSWKQDGIQNAVFAKVKTGGYAVDRHLDLHGLTVKESADALLLFLDTCQHKGARFVLIAHGRGEKSKTPARLKSYLAYWLIQLPNVLAYHSAIQRDGGTGAVYVLLKKSEKLKQENRELFGG